MLPFTDTHTHMNTLWTEHALGHCLYTPQSTGYVTSLCQCFMDVCSRKLNQVDTDYLQKSLQDIKERLNSLGVRLDVSTCPDFEPDFIVLSVKVLCFIRA